MKEVKYNGLIISIAAGVKLDQMQAVYNLKEYIIDIWLWSSYNKSNAKFSKFSIRKC